MSVKERFRLLIKRTKKSQTKLAKELGINPKTLNNIVLGNSMPSYIVLEPLARMGTNINWLLTGKGEMFEGDTEKIINQGNLTNQFGGNNNASISNGLNTSSKNFAHLEKRIQTLESQLADKDKIISLLEGK
ncbi:MAG: helix-turn-helix domain-containing protein [Aureispira sp.]